MDQPENVPSVDPSASAAGVDKPVPRRREGDHAIERIAAAARTLADSVGSSEGEKRKDFSRNALIPASAVSARTAGSGTSAATSIWKRMPSHLPLYTAALCLALGVGAVLGGQFVPMAENKDTVADAELTKIERALPWKRDVAAAQNVAAVKVREDLKAVRGEIAALRSSNDQARHMQELRALRVALEAQKAETASLKADLAARLDRADRDAAQRSEKAAERVDRLEKRLSDPVVTGSIAKAAGPQVRAETKPEPKPDAKAERPPVRGMVLRDVDQGVALIETKRGLMEVMPGDSIPGAGRVETIEKHAGKWRVVTTTGIIDDKPD